MPLNDCQEINICLVKLCCGKKEVFILAACGALPSSIGVTHKHNERTSDHQITRTYSLTQYSFYFKPPKSHTKIPVDFHYKCLETRIEFILRRQLWFLRSGVTLDRELTRRIISSQHTPATTQHHVKTSGKKDHRLRRQRLSRLENMSVRCCQRMGCHINKVVQPPKLILISTHSLTNSQPFRRTKMVRRHLLSKPTLLGPQGLLGARRHLPARHLRAPAHQR